LLCLSLLFSSLLLSIQQQLHVILNNFLLMAMTAAYVSILKHCLSMLAAGFSGCTFASSATRYISYSAALLRLWRIFII
jgi:hypothetical protein